MNKVGIAFASFLLGIACTIGALRLSSTSAASKVQAQNFFGSDLSYVPRVLPLGVSVPVVRPVPTDGLNANNTVIGSPMIALDGMYSTNNLFSSPKGSEIVYGGGAFKVDHTLFDGLTHFVFIGAAANTVSLLDSLGLLVHSPITEPNPAALPTPQQINKPKHQTSRLRHPLNGEISSQYDGH